MFKTFKIGHKLLMSSVFIVLIFLVINTVSLINLNSFVKQSDLEKHTTEVLIQIEQVLISLIDAETGQRGFILTGQVRYLGPYDAGVSLVNTQIDNLQELTSDNPNQQQRIKQLRLLVADKIEELKQTIDLQTQDQFDEAVSLVLSDKGKDIMDNVRDVLNEMKTEENKLLAIRTQQASESQTLVELILILGSLIGLVLAMVIALVLANTIVESITQTKNAANAIAHGNMDVYVDTSGTDEIAEMSQAIDVMRMSLKRSLDEIKTRAKQLDIKLLETENAKKATLNIIEDVEEEREKVSKEKDKIDAILQSIGDGLIVTDNRGVITVVNDRFEEMTGWSKAEAIGKVFTELIPSVDESKKLVSPENRAISKVLLTGKIHSSIKPGAHSYTRKDKTTFPVLATSTPLLSGKKIFGAVEVFRDYTKEKQVDKAKSEFVSLASHQLRTPLSTINWYTEMLLAGDAGKINDEQKEYLDQIYAGNQRMVDLVNALLNVSRLELGTFVVEPELLDITQIAKDAVAELAALLKEKNIKIIEKYDDLPKINLDKKLIFIVFQNLLSNAVKYSPAGAEVNISIVKNEHDINIVVADKGIGIPDHQQKSMFTKLFRADNVKQTDTSGTGLGLYIVKQILDQSGSKIRFESKQNQGTTFYVSIPLTGMTKKAGTKKLG